MRPTPVENAPSHDGDDPLSVPPSPLAQCETDAAQALNGIMLMQQGARPLRFTDLDDLHRAITGMADHLSPAVGADFDASGISLVGSYQYAQPANAAALAMAIGVAAGIAKTQVVALGMASALMNVGYAGMRSSVEPASPLANDAWIEQESHSERSSAMVAQCGVGDDVALAITQHHERWDGTGYPEGLREAEISVFARVIAIADTYAALRSPRPHRGALGPRTATDFIVGGCGVLFDPELVRVFARRIPQYALGKWVELNTGEGGVVVDPNVGHVCRPVVRVALTRGVAVPAPWDIDLSERVHFTRAVVEREAAGT